MPIIHEAARDTEVCHEADLCVVGGSCTGLFAAVAAARMGLSVALVEGQGVLGGTATAGLVNIWHSLYSTTGEEPIIAGLTLEVIERLQRRDAVALHKPANSSKYAVLNSAELVLELDELLREHSGIRAFLHTRFVAPVVAEDGRLTHVIIEDRTGRRAIAARFFVDASGDGDLLHRAGLATRKLNDLQPPTVCAVIAGMAELAVRDPEFSIAKAVYNPAHAKALKRGFLWHSEVPGLPDARLVAGTRVSGRDGSDADSLTAAELEGRGQVRAMLDILRDLDGGSGVHLAAIAGHIGLRETRHAECLHRLTEDEVLGGVHFSDAIAQGSYRVDVHHSDREGLTFRYLDGREDYVVPGVPAEQGRWRPEQERDPTFYQIPYRALVPKDGMNVLATGRLVDADRGAYGAVRVMVNCNQTGQAAGVAAALALHDGISAAEVDAAQLRGALSDQGCIIK